MGYRYFADDPATRDLIEPTVFDEMLVGGASTHPAKVSGVVTDSAASATAMSAGIKTYNGAIAVDENKQPVQTVLEQAKLQGMKTGVAVTSQIVHATPAAFIAHNESRKNYDQLADSYFDDRLEGQFKADVMLGGGWKYFIRPDRNLVEAFTDAGYEYVDQWANLAHTTSEKPLLGLFADVGLPWALDFTEQHRLLALTETAVRHLENDKGFFLMVEASQVDWAGHANDIAAAMAEMADLDETLQWLKSYADVNGDTLLVVTADHSTGGLTLSRDGDYRWQPDILHGLEQSPQALSQLAFKDKDKHRAEIIEQALGLTLTEAQAKQVKSAEDEKALLTLIKHIIDLHTGTGWTTGGHTAIDVPVMAWGPGKERFEGHQDNTEIGIKIRALLNAHPTAND